MRPLTNKELYFVVPLLLLLPLLVTAVVMIDGGPWWVYFVFLAAELLGGREMFWATIEDRLK